MASIDDSESHTQPTQEIVGGAERVAQPESALPILERRSPVVSLPIKILGFFGIGHEASRARKSLTSMLWNLAWGIAQFLAVTVILFMVKFSLKSPRKPAISEWDACDRPLGVWAALWLVRVVMASALAFWEYKRNCQLHFPSGSDIESANNSGSTPTAPIGDEIPQMEQEQQQGATAEDPLSLPYTHLYSRLTLFSSLVTLVWFVTGNILVYTSFNTCRFDAPRLWWLNFAMLCILYLMVLEVVVLGFVVLIVAPILFIFWNIFLICIGRHPMQHPNTIKPEIGKLPKPIVDKIPLVNYIPAPPSDDLAKETPSFPHIYPPKPKKQKLKFKLLPSFASLGSKSSKVETSDKPTDSEEDKSDSWADNWEKGQYPFVTLEGHRATCAICLNDFEAPPKRKVDDNPTEPNGEDQDREETSASAVKTSTSDEAQESDAADETQADPLKLQDAGVGPQPLRLLGCGHAFHKTCIDPWLTDVSGRCPVCQRPVEPSTPHKSRRL